MTATVDFQLPESLTIAHVQSLHEELEKLVDQHDHDKIVLQGEGVVRADTAGIQLLLAFVHTAKDHQIELDWHKPSDKLKSAVNVLGLKDELGIH